MSQPWIIDTGFLVALLNRSEKSHTWAKTQIQQAPFPLLTCEPVITETCFLLRKVPNGESTVLELIESQALQIDLQLSAEISQIKFLMQRYQSVPMSLADACLVRMSELYPNSPLLTLDSDFQVYRRNTDKIILVVTPESPS
jgi:predicted nucleic acid-binding protein